MDNSANKKVVKLTLEKLISFEKQAFERMDREMHLFDNARGERAKIWEQIVKTHLKLVKQDSNWETISGLRYIYDIYMFFITPKKNKGFGSRKKRTMNPKDIEEGYIDYNYKKLEEMYGWALTDEKVYEDHISIHPRVKTEIEMLKNKIIYVFDLYEENVRELKNVNSNAISAFDYLNEKVSNLELERLLDESYKYLLNNKYKIHKNKRDFKKVIKNHQNYFKKRYE